MNERIANANCFSKTEALHECVSKKKLFSECKPNIVHLMSCLNKNLNPKEFANLHQNYTKNYKIFDDESKKNPNLLHSCYQFKTMVELCESNKL
jgi:hypothetical protein